MEAENPRYLLVLGFLTICWRGFNYDLEKSEEYIERDCAILKRIQEDDALRQYIETSLGKKAEEIFNCAAQSSE